MQTPNSALLMDETAKVPPHSSFAALQLYCNIIDTVHLFLNKEGSFLFRPLYERIVYSTAVQDGSPLLRIYHMRQQTQATFPSLRPVLH